MGYEAVWKILEEIIIELRKKGMATPQTVMNDLKSAKVLMKVLGASEKDRRNLTENRAVSWKRRSLPH